MFIKRFGLLFRAALLVGGLLLPTPGTAEMPTDEATTIRSDRMILQGAEDRIRFEGHVSIQRGDLTLDADQAEVEFEPTGPKTKAAVPFDPASKRARGVSRIEVTGHVEVRQGERRARAEVGIYDQKNGSLTLSGHPETWDAGYHVTGRIMTFFIAERRSVIEESHVVLQPPPGK